MNIEKLKKILNLIDLTNLDSNCTLDDVDVLINKALRSFEDIASCCVWPKFVGFAKKNFHNKKTKVCTVLNFPDGNLEFKDIKNNVDKVILEGVDEIDFVIPYKSILKDDFSFFEELIFNFANYNQIKNNNITLKAIIESGELKNNSLIKKVCNYLIMSNINFIKTSTGKVPVNATTNAAEVILNCIKETCGEKKVGLKVSGGIKTLSSAEKYINLTKQIMGESWVTNSSFRIGTSSLFDVVSQEIEFLEKQKREI